MKYPLPLYVILGLVLWSCNPKQFDLSNAELDVWRPVMAAPLFETSISVNDMMAARDNDSYLKLNDEDGFLSFVYRGQLLEYKANALLQLKGIRKTVDFQIPAGVIPPSGYVSFDQHITIPVGNQIDKVFRAWLKQGRISINSRSTSTFLGKIIISSDHIRSNGSPLLFETELGQSKTQDLAGYVADFMSTAVGHSEFTVKVAYLMAGTPGSTYPASQVEANLTLGALDYSKIYCHITPRKAVDLKDSFDIPFFKLENIEGGIEFLSPRLRFYTQNSFGGSASIAIDKMMGSNEKGENKEVKFNPGENLVKVKRPISEGMIAREDVELNISKSFSEVLSISPNKFYFENAVYVNDDHNPDTNYIFDTSRVVLQSEIEIPLQVKFRRFDFSHTVDANLSDLLMEEFEFIKFQFDMINKFPIELRFQLHFLDGHDNTLDSLFSTGSTLFKSGVVASNGRVENDEIQKVEIIVDKIKSDAFANTKKIKIHFGFNTFKEGEQWVKLYDDYRIGMRCKVLAKGKIKL